MQNSNSKNSDKTGNELSLNSSFKTFYESDNHGYLIKKSERLSSAVHLVTGSIKDTEPLRTRLRLIAIEVVQYASDVSRMLDLGLHAFTSKCLEAGVLLQIAETSGMISSANASMISEEYAGLARFARERFGALRAPTPDLHVELPTLAIPAAPIAPAHFQNPSRPTPVKDSAPRQPAHPSGLSWNAPPVTLPSPVSDSRRSQILGLIDSKGSISIKDAVGTISGVSEKTVQRELGALVDSGVLKKVGERRWSTYSRA